MSYNKMNVDEPPGSVAKIKDTTDPDLSGFHNPMVDDNADHNAAEDLNLDADAKSVDMETVEIKVVEPTGKHELIKSSRLTRKSTYARKRETEENDLISKLLTPFTTFVVKYPSVIITTSVLVIILSAVLAFAVGGSFPSFANPAKGFEPRGTEISTRYIAGSHLVEDSTLSDQPSNRKRRSLNVDEVQYLQKHSYEQFRIIYGLASSGNLFDHMAHVCQWYEEKITTHPSYDSVVQPFVHHIPNYIALLRNKADCKDITPSDVEYFKSLLNDCVGYYKNNSLSECGRISNSCVSRCRYQENVTDVLPNLLYNVFHYLGGSNLKHNPSVLKITSSSSILQGSITYKMRDDYFHSVYETTFKDAKKYKGIVINAYSMQFFKDNLFSTEILTQSSLLIIAIVIVILLGWAFSGSLFLGLMTFGCIIGAMLIAWFVYNRVFAMPFFPFLNITILIFIIGIGADDVFVYTGEWSQAKDIYKIYDGSLSVSYMIKWTTHTLRHASMAMFVTSLTTAAAFYANISSNVIAVKCFGLFSGTAIICNYLLMITLFPCCVIVHERYFSKCMNCCCPSICKVLPVIHSRDQANNDNEETAKGRNIFVRFKEWLAAISDTFFSKHLPHLLDIGRYIFVVVFLILGIVGIVIAFGKPSLQPPKSNSFQYFTSDHPIEQYDLKYKEKFDVGLGGEGQVLIMFNFGVKLVDNGNKFNPDDKGTLVLEQGELDIASNQKWLKQFCANVKAASFYKSSDSCSRIENFFSTVTSACDRQNSDCCNKKLPLDRKTFKTCFSIYHGPSGQKYSKNITKTYSINVVTTYERSMSFDKNKIIFKDLDSWATLQLKNVSTSFNGWWWAGGALVFYDLQENLFTGTFASLGIAIGVAFLVILLTSMDLTLSIFSVVTILFIISITVGILIGDGWTLNIVESTVFSVAAGLSADFTMHYSIAYKSSLFKGNRQRRVEDSISHVGPAMFMGAVTTFVAGLVIYPSTVLAYRQFGTFLMVVMFVSWVYSNFFFLPLCNILGPINNFGDLSLLYPYLRRKWNEKRGVNQPAQNVKFNENAGEVTMTT